MGLKKNTRTDGHYLEGVEVKIDSRLNFNNVGNPLFDTSNGSMMWFLKTGIVNSFTFRDNSKFKNFIQIDTNDDIINVDGAILYNTDPVGSTSWNDLSVPTKAYVDSLVGGNNQLSEILLNGNTSGSTDIYIDNGQKLRTPSIEFDSSVTNTIMSDSNSSAGISFNLLGDNTVIMSNTDGTDDDSFILVGDIGTEIVNNIDAEFGSYYGSYDDRLFLTIGYNSGGFLANTGNVFEVLSNKTATKTARGLSQTFPVLIGGEGNSATAGIVNAVVVGGVNLTADKNDALFAQELRFNSSVNTTVMTDSNSSAGISFNFLGDDDVLLSPDLGSDDASFLIVGRTLVNLGYEVDSKNGNQIVLEDGVFRVIYNKDTPSAGNDKGVVIEAGNNVGVNYVVDSISDAVPVYLGGINQTGVSNIVNAVTLGGDGIIADKDDTAFVNKLEVQNTTNNRVGKQISRNTTTDATITELYLDGSAGTVDIATNSLVSFKIIMTGVQTGGTNGLVGDSMIKQVEGGIKNIAGTTSIIGTITEKDIAIDSGATDWNIYVTADDTSDYLKLEVKGGTGESISWTANIELTEINY